jgi:hypothetical protein
MNPIIKGAIIWFIALLPLLIIINLTMKNKNCCICWAISIFIAIGLSICFARISVNGYLRYAVVWFLMVAITIVAFALSKKTGGGFIDTTRLIVVSIVSIFVPFVMTFLNQYWPTFTISHVSNLHGYECRRNTKNTIILPSRCVFYIKNQSQSVLINTEVRYLFISSKDDGIDEYIIAKSFSDEQFKFAPQEERSFLFSSQNIKQRDHYDHLFLIVQVRHRPLLWPFSIFKEWQAFNYAPQDCLWVTMRKNDTKWNNLFERWYNILDQSDFEKL